jgi:hypothetical protein
VGKLGRAIDRLPQHIKDGIVRDQHWCSDGILDVESAREARTRREIIRQAEENLHGEADACFMGQILRHSGFKMKADVMNEEFDGLDGRSQKDTSVVFRLSPAQELLIDTWGLKNIGAYFDKLCERFGLERIVRCVKKRAAKGNRPDEIVDEQPETEKEAVLT